MNAIIYPKCRELTVASYKKGKLRLIKPTLEHAQQSLQWVRQKEVIQFMGADFSNPSLQGEEKRLQAMLASKNEYNWMIELNGKIIGNAAIRDIAEKTKEFKVRAGNFTILIGDKRHWGKGIATAVAKAVTNWAFHEADFQVIFARVLKPNIGSIKTLEKIGFQKIGTSPYEKLIDSKQVEWINFKLSTQKVP